MQNAGLDEAQTEIKIARRNVYNFRYADDTTFMAESEKELKSLLMGEGEGGEIWQNSIETCIISCMKQVASPGSMHGTGCLGLVHWDDPEGG